MPWIGYKAAKELAREALASGDSVYSLVLGNNLLSQEKLAQILAPENMLSPAKMKDE